MALKGENETLISIDHDTKMLHVYSTSRKWWSRCQKMKMTLVKEFTNKSDRVVAMRFVAPLSKVTGSLRRGGVKRRKKE